MAAPPPPTIASPQTPVRQFAVHVTSHARDACATSPTPGNRHARTAVRRPPPSDGNGASITDRPLLRCLRVILPHADEAAALPLEEPMRHRDDRPPAHRDGEGLHDLALGGGVQVGCDLVQD